MGLRPAIVTTVLGCSLIIISCQIFFGKDCELSLTRRDYNGEELRVNGFYYSLYDNDKMVTTYFLFRNGIILYAGSCELAKFDSYKKSFFGKEFGKAIQQAKYMWGVFQIEKNLIQFERWYPSEKPYKTWLKKGVILNDSTFVVTQSIHCLGDTI